MKYKLANINGNIWKLEILSHKKLLEKLDYYYPKKTSHGTDGDGTMFGACSMPNNTIYIIDIITVPRAIKIVAHEVVHAIIYENALSDIDNFNEEVVCELMSKHYKKLSDIIDNEKLKNFLNKHLKK